MNKEKSVSEGRDFKKLFKRNLPINRIIFLYGYIAISFISYAIKFLVDKNTIFSYPIDMFLVSIPISYLFAVWLTKRTLDIWVKVNTKVVYYSLFLITLLTNIISITGHVLTDKVYTAVLYKTELSPDILIGLDIVLALTFITVYPLMAFSAFLLFKKGNNN